MSQSIPIDSITPALWMSQNINGTLRMPMTDGRATLSRVLMQPLDTELVSDSFSQQTMALFGDYACVAVRTPRPAVPCPPAISSPSACHFRASPSNCARTFSMSFMRSVMPQVTAEESPARSAGTRIPSPSACATARSAPATKCRSRSSAHRTAISEHPSQGRCRARE